MAALERLKGRRAEAHSSQGCSPGAPGRLSAARSHVLNDEYMARFHAQLAACTMSAEGPGAAAELPGAHRPDACTSLPPQQLPSSIKQPSREQPSTGATPPAPAATPADGWWVGPADPAGIAIPLAQSNLLCASVDWKRGEAAFGSADHAVYTIDLRRHTKARTLYSQRHGHTEWVTALLHLPHSGGLVSGGMDSKLCLWNRARTGCSNLAGHSGSISQLAPCGTAGPAAAGDRFLSASYDRTVVVWDAGTGRALRTLLGHCAPVLQLCTAPGAAAVASGDRSGNVLVWDLEAGAASSGSGSGSKPQAAHEGHVTALAWADGGLLSGGQDGCLRLWDCRGGRQRPVAEATAHTGPAGCGAVGGIAASAGGVIVTAGADGTVKGWEARQGLQQLWAARLPDFPYSLCTLGGLVLAGCGDGSLLVIDGASGWVLYALGASTAAVRTIHAAGGQLIVGGDDGMALLYNFCD